MLRPNTTDISHIGQDKYIYLKTCTIGSFERNEMLDEVISFMYSCEKPDEEPNPEDKIFVGYMANGSIATISLDEESIVDQSILLGMTVVRLS